MMNSNDNELFRKVKEQALRQKSENLKTEKQALRSTILYTIDSERDHSPAKV